MATAPRIEKLWGYEETWAKTDHYAGRILHIAPGQSMPLQYHTKRRATIRVLEGALTLTHFNENEEPVTRELGVGDTFTIWSGLRYRLRAASKIVPVKVIEVSTPEHDDVIRINDAHRR